MSTNRLKLRPVGLAAALTGLLSSAATSVLVAPIAISLLRLCPRRIAVKYAPWRSTPLAPRLERPG